MCYQKILQLLSDSNMRHRQEEAVIYLFEHNLNARQSLNTRDVSGLTPLMRAVQSGSILFLKNLLLIRSIDLNVRAHRPDHADNGKTAVYLAYEKGCDIMMCMLLEAGAKLSKPIEVPMLEKAARFGNVSMIERLLNEHLELSKIDKNKLISNLLFEQEEFGWDSMYYEDALRIAAGKGYNHVLRYLIEKEKPFLNVPICVPGCPEDGKTALDLAFEAGHRVTVSILLEAGAQPNKNKESCIRQFVEQKEILSVFSMFNREDSSVDEEISAEEMADSAFGQASNTAKRMTCCAA